MKFAETKFAVNLKTLCVLYFTFAKMGAVTFGGGLAMMPVLQKELITKRGWITDEELLDYYAIGQSTPGIIAVNVSTFVGYKQLGVLGGIVATLGIVTPSLLIIMLLAKLIDSVDEFPAVQKALKGVNVAVAALLTKVSFDFCKKTIRNVFSAALVLCSFVLVYFFKVQSFFVILGAVLIGAAVYFVNNPSMRKQKSEDRENVSSDEENVRENETEVPSGKKNVSEDKNA